MNFHKFSFEGSSAVAEEIAVPMDVWRIAQVTIHISADPAVADLLTITLDAEDGVDFDAELHSKDMNGLTSYVWAPEGDHLLFGGESMHLGDRLDIAYANAASRDTGIRVILQRVGTRG